MAARCRSATCGSFGSLFAVALCASLIFASAPGTPRPATGDRQPGKRDDVAGLSLADLRALPELPKPHYSFPLRSDWLNPVHPFLPDYVRITHAASIGPWHSERHVKNALSVCRMVNASQPRIPAVLAVNLSPYHEFRPAADDFGESYVKEIDRAKLYFESVSRWLREFNRDGSPVSVGAVLLECERYDFRASNAPELNEAIIRKYDAMYMLAKRYFPDAIVEWYRRGGINKVERPPDWQVTWAQYMRFSGRELGDTYSCQIYRVPELGYEREALDRTARNAAAAGVPMNVWLSLGAGYRRDLSTRTGERYELDWDYDKVYSWLIGLELNRQPDVPQAVIFYPAAFDPRVGQWGKHFAAYVQGAARARPFALKHHQAGAPGMPPFDHESELAAEMRCDDQAGVTGRRASCRCVVKHAQSAPTAR